MTLPEELQPEFLLQAYAQGYFPMGGYEDGEIRWFSPESRGVIPLDGSFHIPHGLKKTLKKGRFEIRMDTAFPEVIAACAAREEVWIDEQIRAAYIGLHTLGFAHSVETWDEEGLQGGLYGVALGRAFFGESMFSRKSDASKVALVALVRLLEAEGYTLLDSQWLADHLRQFGASEIPRREYMKRLRDALSDLMPPQTNRPAGS